MCLRLPVTLGLQSSDTPPASTTLLTPVQDQGGSFPLQHVYTIPNWARSLSSMSPNASQGQTTAESARHENMSPDWTWEHRIVPDYTWNPASPPRPSIPGTSLSNLLGGEREKTPQEVKSSLRVGWISTNLISGVRGLLEVKDFAAGVWDSNHSPLLSGFGSLALELPGLLLLELGGCGLGAFSCCVHRGDFWS